MNENRYYFSYTSYIEIDSCSVPNGVKVSGPKKITKTGMYRYCWPGCLTVMYDAEKVGLIQIPDIKKNNDYAMWLKVCEEVNCYLLDEILAAYRFRRCGSISTHSYRTLIVWHYNLFKNVVGRNTIVSAMCTLRNLFWGYYKKLMYKKVR